MINKIREHRVRMNYSNDVEELWLKLGEEIKELLDEVFKRKITVELGEEVTDVLECVVALLDTENLDLIKIKDKKIIRKECAK